MAIPPVLFVFSDFLHPSTDSISSSLFYMDDGCITVSSDSLTTNNFLLKHYFFFLRDSFIHAGFILEFDKNKLCHFPSSRKYMGLFPPLTLFNMCTITPSETWRYLGFWLDHHLTFCHHVQFYSNLAFSTVRAYPVLSNSLRGLSPLHKRTLYISCVRPLLTYGFRVWFSPACTYKYLLTPL